MAQYGLFIDYDYCCGCHTCEIACQKEHGYEPGEFGVTVQQIGPWKIRGTKKYQFDYLPFPTKLCDLCEERTALGKQPTCVQHCQTGCMKFGEAENLVEENNNKTRVVLFIPR